MPDILTYAKEVYQKTPRDTHGESKVVPIRGMYVTGVWQPPEYVEPILQLLSFKRNHCRIQDYIETTKSHTSDTTHHLYDVSINTAFRIDYYSTATAPAQTHDTTHHLYDVSINPTFRMDYYTTISASQTHDTTHHLLDIIINDTHPTINCPRDIGGSHPEPILRLIEFNCSGITIEDIT